MKSSYLPYIIAGATGAIIATVTPLLISSSRADTKLLPFQGRLTDAAGNAIADGAKVVEFKMYDAPTGGNVKWAGEVHKLSVNGGLVNTMLGSKAGLGAVDFSLPCFLQITVDANNDGQITAADPPLLPRQSVLASVYANEAGTSRDSQKFAGYLLGQLPGAMPVGTVVMWWGHEGSIPAGWELCNGSPPAIQGALLTGNKPNLVNRFPKGSDGTTANVQAANRTGGQHSIPQRMTGGTAITIAQMPNHTHTDSGHSHGTSRADGTQGGAGLLIQTPAGPGDKVRNAIDIISVNTGFANIQPTGGNQPHDHTIPGHDNQPEYLEVFFIIRVK